MRQETVGAVVEALPCQVHVVSVQHTMDEPGRDPSGRQMRRARHHRIQQRDRRIGRTQQIRIVGLDRIGNQALGQVGALQIGLSLKCPEANMAVAKAEQNR